MFSLCVVALLPRVATAQCTSANDSRSASPSRLTLIGGAADDSARLGSLLGACWGNGSLIRSSSILERDQAVSSSLRLTVLDPVLSNTWNSRIPVSFNDGAMWAGRGLNTSVSAGLRLERGPLRIVLFPQYVTSQNVPFAFLASQFPERSRFASPWGWDQMSRDIPIRFGNERYTRLDPGETTAELRSSRVALGATSAPMWWGPGSHNALLMSNNAAGVPQVYLRTAQPIATPLGRVEAYWMLGGLLESPFFDYDTRNDLRSLSGAAVTLRVAGDSGLTVGAARVVYAFARRFGRVPGHFLDVFTDWHRTSASGIETRHSDQLTSFFARWVFPQAGLEFHTEWAKLQPPAAFRELLVEPNRRQGYVIGLDWAKPIDSRTTFRMGAEATMLEQTPAVARTTTSEFYASHSVVQGYTQQGQPMGAAIGPGSSSQHFDAALYRGQWQIGATIGRVRWSEDAYYTPLSAAAGTYKTHDVSLMAGLNARLGSKWGQFEASLLGTNRLNYLFQTHDPFTFGEMFDVRNTTVSVRVTPALSSVRSLF